MNENRSIIVSSTAVAATTASTNPSIHDESKCASESRRLIATSHTFPSVSSSFFLSSSTKIFTSLEDWWRWCHSFRLAGAFLSLFLFCLCCFGQVVVIKRCQLIPATGLHTKIEEVQIVCRAGSARVCTGALNNLESERNERRRRVRRCASAGGSVHFSSGHDIACFNL